MRKLITLVLPAFAMLLGFSSTYAQDAGPTWSPTELYACNFVGDADMDDLNGAIEAWNEWEDENGTDNYTAVVLTPNFRAPSFAYEVIWVGTWRNGAGLGGLQRLFTDGAEILEGFGEVLDCGAHQGFAGTNVQPLGEPTGIVPVSFTNCTLHEGRIGPEAGAAMARYIEFLTENGSDAGHWVLRPGIGEEADATYSFKWVTAYTSFDALGHGFELFYNGGGQQRLEAEIGRIMSCDSARVYNSQLVREMAEE
jgi:hypothetical protein